jgi:hypothetical protein
MTEEKEIRESVERHRQLNAAGCENLAGTIPRLVSVHLEVLSYEYSGLPITDTKYKIASFKKG